ncbi:Tol-Pal system protein TolB, partial [Acinetobacter baumannii]
MKTSRKHLLALTLLTALSPLAPTAAFAQLHLEIAKAPDQAPKIAIVPFNNDNGLYPIVETDLNRSGRFTSSSKNLPANAAINQIQASDWQAAGIPYVVTGQIKQTADGFEVHYQLYDVQKQQYLLNELLNVPASRIRQAGHMVSDAIYQALTGIPGDFSGRIAY